MEVFLSGPALMWRIGRIVPEGSGWGGDGVGCFSQGDLGRIWRRRRLVASHGGRFSESSLQFLNPLCR